MYINFTYQDGSNPYISTTSKNLFGMICKYCLRQTGARSFEVLGKSEIWTSRPDKKLSAYQKKRFFLEEFAKQWQYDFAEMIYSWEDVIFWGNFFETYGKKYGLLREFRENGIC